MSVEYEEVLPSKDFTKPRCGDGVPWDKKDFKDATCYGELVNDKLNGDIVVQGTVTNPNVNKIMFWAAAPPTYGTSFSGSGMPYPDALVAFDRTPNRGSVNVVNGLFKFRIKYPNAYYAGLGTLYIPPHVNLRLCQAGLDENHRSNRKVSVVVDDGIPFRTLTYPAPPSKKPRISPMFYCEPSHGARTQETILRQSGYPSKNVMPDNFWGKRPPR